MANQNFELRARVTVHRPDEMTPNERKQIALWLRRTAHEVSRTPQRIKKRYTTRFHLPQTRLARLVRMSDAS